MRIVILGAGHMGSWLANELSKEHEVVVYDTNQAKTKHIKNVQIISDLSELSKIKPDLLINAVSLQNTISAFDSVLEFLGKDCLLVDVTSIKTGLSEYYKKCGLRFISVHPMFGPTFANVEALSDENIVIIKESDQQGKDFFEKLAENKPINLEITRKVIKFRRKLEDKIKTKQIELEKNINGIA